MKKLIFFTLLLFSFVAYSQCIFNNKCDNCFKDEYYTLENAENNVYITNIGLIDKSDYRIITAREPYVLNVTIFYNNGTANTYLYMSSVSINKIKNSLILRYIDITKKGKELKAVIFDNVCGVSITAI